QVANALIERTARPQDDAVGVRIAGRDAFRIEMALLAPSRARCSSRRRPHAGRAHGGCRLHELAAIERHLLPLHVAAPTEVTSDERRNDRSRVILLISPTDIRAR